MMTFFAFCHRRKGTPLSLIFFFPWCNKRGLLFCVTWNSGHEQPTYPQQTLTARSSGATLESSINYTHCYDFHSTPMNNLHIPNKLLPRGQAAQRLNPPLNCRHCYDFLSPPLCSSLCSRKKLCLQGIESRCLSASPFSVFPPISLSPALSLSPYSCSVTHLTSSEARRHRYRSREAFSQMPPNLKF